MKKNESKSNINIEDKDLNASPKKPYQAPQVLSSERLEAAAVACPTPGPLQSFVFGKVDTAGGLGGGTCSTLGS